mgnify:CR=1 FL=1
MPSQSLVFAIAELEKGSSGGVAGRQGKSGMGGAKQRTEKSRGVRGRVRERDGGSLSLQA